MNATMNQNFVSASELSRLMNRPVQRVLKAIKSGAIAPDSTTLDGRLFLFNPERVDEIKQKLEN